METPETVEHFHGVYLLYSLHEKYKGKIYIGYTVHPCRRIKQHNAGKQSGGASKTNMRGPWDMVLIVHGFPSKIAALRFEWAWQHPHRSRRLRHVSKRKSNQTLFEYHLMILSEMFMVGPWCRLPLIIRWLNYEFSEKYKTSISSPLHMPICYGKVVPRKVVKKRSKKNVNDEADTKEVCPILYCSICGSITEKNETISCINPSCHLVVHLICLARQFSTDDKILPIEGTCPSCHINVLWGDLIRKMIGCYQDLQNDVDDTPVLINSVNDIK